MPSLPKPRLRRAARGTLISPPAEERREPNVQTVSEGGFRWVNIERPSPLEAAWLEEQFGFHALDLEDVLSRNQRPKIDEYPEYLFIVLHFPVFDRSVGRLNTGELDIFVGPDYLVTIPNQRLQPVQYLFERCRQKEELREQHFSRGSGFLLYRIVDDSFDYCFPMLRKIGNKLDALEDEIFEGRSEEVVRDISNVKQEIINFRKITRPQRPVLRDLESMKHRFLAALDETNESVISHRVNDILRVLTVISVTLLPLTLLASIFGMNVRVPGQGSTTAFWIVVAAMIVMLGG